MITSRPGLMCSDNEDDPPTDDEGEEDLTGMEAQPYGEIEKNMDTTTARIKGGVHKTTKNTKPILPSPYKGEDEIEGVEGEKEKHTPKRGQPYLPPLPGR